MYIWGFRALQHLRSLTPVLKWWWMIMMAKWYSGNLWAQSFLTFVSQVRKKPREKTSPRKLVSTGDRTRARCVTSAHVTTCPTAGEQKGWRMSSAHVASPTSQLILQPFSSLYLRHNSFSNPSVASPTSQLILQPLFRSFYVTGSSLTSREEAPMLYTRLVSVCHKPSSGVSL